MEIINLLTGLSYLALIIDVLLQIRRIHYTKSSHDISLTGIFFRLVASLVIMVKLISIKDIPLLVGQGLFVITFIAYFYLTIIHVKHRRK